MTEQLGTVESLGSAARPLRVAIILAQAPRVFMLLVPCSSKRVSGIWLTCLNVCRHPMAWLYGVAPDHQKIKSVAKVYDGSAAIRPPLLWQC